MATATIRIKKGTTAEWTESRRVLDDGEMGLELTTVLFFRLKEH